jgi:hypothetical protein
MRSCFCNHLHTLIHGKHARLSAIYQDCNNNFIELGAGALDDIEVPKGYWIERSWADSALHMANASKKISRDPFQA